jgi:hypothetical protein
MKKINPVIIIFIVFMGSFIYLHQKIEIYVQAYQLSSNYHVYNELVDKKDYLMYNFTKEISIAKVNQWAQSENFRPVSKDQILAVGLKGKEPSAHKSFAQLLDDFLGASATTSTALANDLQ